MDTIIENQIINPDLNDEIYNLLRSRNKWRLVSNISETTGHILTVAATILSFASGVYKCNDSLAFASGCVNVSAISILKFSSYASGESNERNKQLNSLLSRYHIAPLPQPIINNNTPEENIIY
jgi:hypothetical protein